MISERKKMKTIIWADIAIISSNLMPVEDFAVCVEDNYILDTGSRQEMVTLYPDAKQVGDKNFIMIPAFVNSHDHGRGLGTASLGIQDDLLEIWMLGVRFQPKIDPYLAAAYDGIRQLRSGVGTTTHNQNPTNWSNVPVEADAILRAYRDVGIRVAFQPIILDQNTLAYDNEHEFVAGLPKDVQRIAQTYLDTPLPSKEDYFSMSLDLLNKYHDPVHHTTQVQVSPNGGQWCSDEITIAAVEFAQKHNTKVHMHMLETKYQRYYAINRWGKTFLRHLDDIGVLGPWLTLAHMIWVEDSDLSLLAERGVCIATNPGSNLRVRSGIASIAKFLKSGIPVGVGLDGYTIGEGQDFLRELRLAWTLCGRPGANNLPIPSQLIWQMGWDMGAVVAMGKAPKLGKLIPGHLADLTLLDKQAIWGSWAPEGYPLKEKFSDLLLHLVEKSHVKHVMVNGEWVVWHGQATKIDEASILLAIKDELSSQGLNKVSSDDSFRQLIPFLRDYYAKWHQSPEMRNTGIYNCESL